MLCKRIKTKQNKTKQNNKNKRKMANHKKDTQKHKETKKASQQPSYLLLPNSQLLRGVPVQTHGEYKLPTNTDVFTFAAKKLINE